MSFRSRRLQPTSRSGTAGISKSEFLLSIGELPHYFPNKGCGNDAVRYN